MDVRPRSTLLDLDGLQRVVDLLDADVHAPVVRADDLVVAPIRSVGALPVAWGSTSVPGEVTPMRRSDRARFGWALTSSSWKSFVHPPRIRTMTIGRSAAPGEGPGDDDRDGRRGGDAVPVSVTTRTSRRQALIGVRPCELAALDRLDTVLSSEPIHRSLRDDTFIAVVNCSTPASTCFCTSMDTGPHVEGRTTSHDLEITELVGDDDPVYVVHSVSRAGERLLAALAAEDVGEAVEDHHLTSVGEQRDRAEAAITRRLDPDDVRHTLADAHESPHWSDVGDRCLACANCTSVCPTCFCTNLQDIDRLGESDVERWRTWDSCFGLEFSRVGSSPIRSSIASRYRQWMTHKLDTWHDQFGESGCVGCGRCIAWCPVGIDIAAEADALEAVGAGAT
ncbi:MAG: 4Fe-4S dicluster domain-containing protein [Actinomycetota bacterium]